MAMHDNPLFSTAADFVNNTSRHIFLTGKAGTGKTTFLKYIKENTPKKSVVVAPTGVAAINAGGVTMHSFFQLPLGPFVPVTQKLSGSGFTDQYTLFKNIRISEEKRELFRDLELLIIDEVSMVRCDMLDATDAILRYFRKMPKIPFGGVQVLYIGDLFQLPPVMPDTQWSLLREYYSSPFFFDSKAVQQAPPVYVELKKIYRQTQQSFIDILNRIRNDEATREDLETLNSRGSFQPHEGQKYITLTTHNYKADKINADELKQLQGKCFEFKGSVEGDFPDKTLPTEVVLQLKEGAQVMFIRNDKNDERRYYNGKIATVKKIDKEGVRVVLAESDEELVLEQETWNNIRYSYNQEDERIDEEKLGSFTQYPVRLAWAITIHKSQGLTFQHAIIDAGESFAPGQVYVALSRCTSLEGLILRSKIVPSSISTDPLVLEFARREADDVELERLLQKEKLDFKNLQLAMTFDLQKLVDSVANYLQYLQGKLIPDPKGATGNARNMHHHVEELQKIALKFQQQMKDLVQSAQEEKLIERVNKAIAYFSRSLTDELLDSLDQHITSIKGAKKVKKYLKYVRQLRNAVARKIDSIQKVQYGEVVFNPAAIEMAVAQENSRSEKQEKGSSLRETLSLLRSGMRPVEIADKRSLALSTIEGHVAQLIKSGDIDIHECMEENKVRSIVTVIREIQAVSMQPVKQKLGDDFSYGEIRAVMNHLSKEIKE
ncbi:MAG: helix-turn-helix domain-containing protein [Cyclobacteriaceae bacterium]